MLILTRLMDTKFYFSLLFLLSLSTTTTSFYTNKLVKINHKYHLSFLLIQISHNQEEMKSSYKVFFDKP